MKYHASRYGLTAGLGSLTCSAVMIGMEKDPVQWVIAAFLAVFIGIFCMIVVPYHDQGDK